MRCLVGSSEVCYNLPDAQKHCIGADPAADHFKLFGTVGRVLQTAGYTGRVLPQPYTL